MNALRISATAMLSLAALIGTVIAVAAADRDPCDTAIRRHDR